MTRQSSLPITFWAAVLFKQRKELIAYWKLCIHSQIIRYWPIYVAKFITIVIVAFGKENNWSMERGYSKVVAWRLEWSLGSISWIDVVVFFGRIMVVIFWYEDITEGWTGQWSNSNKPFLQVFWNADILLMTLIHYQTRRQKCCVPYKHWNCF